VLAAACMSVLQDCLKEKKQLSTKRCNTNTHFIFAAYEPVSLSHAVLFPLILGFCLHERPNALSLPSS
jgi:hypothetical protein